MSQEFGASLDALQKNKFHGKNRGKARTFPVNLCTTQRETVTVAVLFMKPAFVTTPVKAIGGMVFDVGRRKSSPLSAESVGETTVDHVRSTNRVR